MRKITAMKLGGCLALCVAGVYGWTSYANANPTYDIGKSVPSTELSQLQKNYGIHFIASPSDANKEPISAQQAVAVANEGYLKPVTMEAVFGYMTINSKGNAVFVPPTTKAGSIEHGVVKNYPVWLVSRSNVPLYISGKAGQPREALSKLLKVKGSYLTFIDATNGQRFFTVTTSN